MPIQSKHRDNKDFFFFQDWVVEKSKTDSTAGVRQKNVEVE